MRPKFYMGDKVMFTSDLEHPRFGWGGMNGHKEEVGTIRYNAQLDHTRNEYKYEVHFPSHFSWSGMEHELVLFSNANEFEVGDIVVLDEHCRLGDIFEADAAEDVYFALYNYPHDQRWRVVRVWLGDDDTGVTIEVLPEDIHLDDEPYSFPAICCLKV